MTALPSIVCGLLLGGGVWLMLAVVLDRRKSTTTPARPALRRRFTGANVRRTSLTLLVAALISVALGFISGIPGLGLVAGITAVAVPWMMRRSVENRRARQLNEEWPAVIDALVAALRAGGTVTGAMAALASSSRGVVAQGARDFMIAVSTTSDVSSSLTLVKESWDSAVGDRIIETLRLASECGGVGSMHGLIALARDVRRESGVRAEVRARAAWIRVAAIVGAVAPWIAVVVLGTRPEGREAYGTPAGTLVLITGYAVTVVAYLLVNRIAQPATDVRVLA